MTLVIATGGFASTAHAQDQLPPPQGAPPAATAPGEAENAPVVPPGPAPQPIPPPPPHSPYGPPQNYPQYGYGQGYYTSPYNPEALPPHGIYRPFSFTLTAGPGMLRGPDKYGDAHEMGLSYGFRFGFGLEPNLQLQIGFESTGIDATSPDPDLNGAPSWLSQDFWWIGVQYHFVRHLYVRGGMGAGTLQEDTDFTSYSSGHGTVFVAAFGYEFVQGPHVALGLEANASVSRYGRERETWTTGGMNLTLSFY